MGCHSIVATATELSGAAFRAFSMARGRIVFYLALFSVDQKNQS